MPGRSRSARRRALVGAAAVLSIWPAAGAAAAWTSPQTLSPAPAAGTPTLSFGDDGGALATWATAGGAGRRSAARLPSRAAFGPSRAAPDIGQEIVEGLPPAPVVDRSGRVIAIAQRKVRPACGLATIYTLTPRFGRVSGSFAPARGSWTIFSHTEPPAVALAGNRDGVAVVAWLQLHRDAHGRCVEQEDVRVAVRRPGGAFAAPVTLARGASSGTIVASVSGDGELLVAWRHGAAIETRSRSAHGTWRATSRIDAGGLDSLAATLGADGTAYLVWTRTRPTGADRSARVVGAAVRAARATRFSTSILERGTWPVALIDRPERRMARVALSRGGAIAAWTSATSDHLRVLTAMAPGARFAAARPATPEGRDFALGDLAVSRAGRPALALTADTSQTPSGPFVVLGAAAGGGFGLPEAVGPGSAAINGEALAFSPRTGRPTLVWTQFRTVMAATRSAAP